MEFRQINIKTGKDLPLPTKNVENTYLEQKFGKEIDPTRLAIGKIYDGITADDIEQLKEQGLHIILASGRTAYFADRAIAVKISQEIFTNHSDAVAYGSLPVSAAKASIFKETAKVLVIDDESLTKDIETGIYTADWGTQPITLSNGITLSDKAMGAIASKLGDCYSLVSSDLATQLEAEPNRPFQFRAGVPEWQGVIKGTCRESLLCKALEVDAIIAKSSIKGDGKTTNTGIHEVDLFWSRKENAKLTEQKLGTQALVYFPEGVQADILPKLKAKAESLAEAQSDPRKIAQLYIKRYEQRLERSQELEEKTNSQQLIEPELAQELGLSELANLNEDKQQIVPNEKEYKDWMYEVLKADTIDGGHCQILEMEDINKRLQEFMQSEWVDVATGGIYVPSGIAQPSNQLQEGEISFKGLPDGAKVGIYRSPVANAANFDVFTNNLSALRENDLEAYVQKGVCYMNPSDAKRLVIDFDGDRVAIIPSQLTPAQQAQTKKEIEQFPTLVNEIIDKNLPEHKPVQVEKEKKIPRDKEHGFPNLASAAVNAADNPTGKVANLGMKLEALRWDIQNIPTAEKPSYLENIGKHFQKVLSDDRNGKKQFEILDHDWREKISDIGQIASEIPKLPETDRAIAVDQGLAKTERLLWDLESLTAVNLQRAVDTPKSARKVDEQEFNFCQTIGKFKSVEWIQDKENKLAYLGDRGIETNTQDPVGWMVEQANQIHCEGKLIGDRNYNRFDHIFPKDNLKAEHTVWAKEVAAEYGSQIAKAISSRDRLEHEEEIAITATSPKGNVIQIVSPSKADPDGKSPIWDLAKAGESVAIQIDQNKDWRTKNSYPYKAVAIVDDEIKVDIGLISPETLKKHGTALEIGRVLPDLKLDLSLGISNSDVKEMFTSAEQYLETQAAVIPESERESRATALWHNNNRAIAGKMFTEIVTDRLQKLQVEKVKVIGLQHETNQLKDKQWQPNESINCRMTLESNPDSPIFDKRVIQVQQADEWKNIGVLSKDAAYMPIGTEFKANVNLSANKKEADLGIDSSSMKLPEVWLGLSPERVEKALNIDAISPSLKQAIVKAAENKPTMTEFVRRLAAENVGVKAQIQQGGKVIHGITYQYEGQSVKASAIEMSWGVISSMGVRYDPNRDREALTSPIPPQTETQLKLPVEQKAGQIEVNTQPNVKTNPLSQIEHQLRGSVLSHFGKDKAMAEIATQFIGKASTPINVYSSTRLYEQAWGELANTGKYKSDDAVMVSGSGPWRREGDERPKPQIEKDLKQLFEGHYKPLLDQAIAAGSQILVGNAKGTDQLVVGYLQEKGYALDWQPQGYYQALQKQREHSDQPVKITGKPIQMVYPLKMHGEVNSLLVDTCIEAMRGHGRSHTTRRFEPHAAYGIKEGDIAIAYAGEKKVAIEVGKQYQISQKMLTDTEYQKQWVSMEKHGSKELQTFQGHSNTWGMHFKSLGDYVDGKIVPFPICQKEIDPLVTDIQKLESWRQTAEYLGKSEGYVNRIQEIIEGESISEKAQQAMAKDIQALGQHTASQWRKILSTNNDFIESQDGNLVFERKGAEGKYRATWEQSTDTLTLDAKTVEQGSVKYSPLLIQKGLEVTQSQIAVKDAKNVDLALKAISEKQKGTQEQR
jgi:hypothetical protein